MKEPTSDECSANIEVEPGYFACWYPQMGGYSSHCLIHDLKSDAPGCFDAYVWSDGEFPFDREEGRDPVVLHHCGPEQFIRFGEFVKSKILGEVK